MKRRLLLGCILAAMATRAAAQPNNFRALYDAGVAQGNQGNLPAAIATLKSAIASLHGSAAPDLTIYNTLGWYCMQSGQYKAAEQWYLVAYRNSSGLTLPSRQKLLNNMGTLYALEGDKASATRYFNEAGAAGSYGASANLKRLVGVAR